MIIGSLIFFFVFTLGLGFLISNLIKGFNYKIVGHRYAEKEIKEAIEHLQKLIDNKEEK